MKELEEFKVDGRELNLRIKHIPVTKLLSLQVMIDFKDLNKTEELMSFVFENIEVNLNGSWINLKEKGRDVYYPTDLKTDLKYLSNVFIKFLNEFLKPLF